MQKVAVTVNEACRMLSISRTLLYTRLADAESCLRSTKVGRRRLILTESIYELLGCAAPSVGDPSSGR